MFLDTACFFIGEQKDMVISIWDGSSSDGILWSGWHGFQILENKCLVEVDHDKHVRMHDHLRDLGREIAIKERLSRFWSYSQFVHSRRPLDERLPMRGIMAATGNNYGECNSHYEPPFEECMQLLTEQPTSPYRRFTPSALGVQLLVVKGDYFKEQFAKLSEELVWLRWYGFPHERLPSWLSTGKLRVLELYCANRLAGLWGPNDSPPLQLRELIINNMSGKLQMIPKTIGVLKHLKKIVFKGGDIQEKIISLPDEFCLLESLEHLELTNFSHVSSLPTDFGKLRKLKYINLTGCTTLRALPVSFNQLTELQYLNLSCCENLQLEKDILENITKLEKLMLGLCLKLQQLPSEITRQMYLRELDLSPTGLRELPADIDRLAKLEVLEIGSRCLTSLPTSLGNLPSLIKLKIDQCRELKCLPSLRNLPCLIELEIVLCTKLTQLPPVGCLTRLEKLRVISLGTEYLPEGFEHLVSLQNLEIWFWPIRELPLANPEECYSNKPRLLNHVDSSMFKFPRLKRIFLRGTKVSAISISKDCCPSLEDLYLSHNHDLMEIETLPTTLKRVEIYSCEKLENIRGVAGLAELQVLEIRECSGLDELPSFVGLAELQNLQISFCPIRELPLANPEERSSKKPRLLNSVDSSMIKPEIFPMLQSIHLEGTKVSTVSISEDSCPSLEKLHLSKNHDLTEIETLSTTLKRMEICTCEKLENIRGVASLVKLQRLEIVECPELDELPSFACCTCLEVLKIDVSRRVTKIEGLEELRSLTNLQIRAERRSAIETNFPPYIVKRGCGMEIVGRAVEDVESVVASLSFPNFTVVDTLHKWNRGCHMKSPLSNASCVIVCFVISQYSQMSDIWYKVGSESHPTSYARFDGSLPLLEGAKQVYIGVWPKGFQINDFVEGTERVFLTLSNLGHGDIEKGMAVMMKKGEEEKTLEALYKFFELLQR